MPPVLELPDRPSIAVLPFANMSGDAEQDYFADGMVEEIITALSRMRWLFVIARNSSFTYRGRSIDVKQVGRELGVRYVLEGSVRKAGPRVRIAGQLIDASSGRQLWADRFEGGLADVFDLQDRVTASVVGAVAPGWSGPNRPCPAQAHRQPRRLRPLPARHGRHPWLDTGGQRRGVRTASPAPRARSGLRARRMAWRPAASRSARRACRREYVGEPASVNFMAREHEQWRNCPASTATIGCR